MEKFLEEQLKQRLEEGVDVFSLAPYTFSRGKILYKVCLYDCKGQIIIESSRDMDEFIAHSSLMKIVEVRLLLHGAMVPVKTNLTNAYVRFEKPKNLTYAYKSYSRHNINLTGTLSLTKEPI